MPEEVFQSGCVIELDSVHRWQPAAEGEEDVQSDRPVVAMRPGNAGGAKGATSREDDGTSTAI